MQMRVSVMESLVAPRPICGSYRNLGTRHVTHVLETFVGETASARAVLPDVTGAVLGHRNDTCSICSLLSQISRVENLMPFLLLCCPPSSAYKDNPPELTPPSRE